MDEQDIAFWHWTYHHEFGGKPTCIGRLLLYLFGEVT